MSLRTCSKLILGVTIHGRVILPESSNETFSSRSCLTIKAQEFKLCGGGANCMHPLTTKETFRDFRLEAHTIPYAIVIPNIVTGHFIISALLNVDWCKDDDVTSQDFIHNGDYHNEETHDFVISEGMTDILKDIKLEEYNDVVTCKCLVSSFICWKCFLVLTFLFCYVLLFCIFSIKFFTYYILPESLSFAVMPTLQAYLPYMEWCHAFIC